MITNVFPLTFVLDAIHLLVIQNSKINPNSIKYLQSFSLTQNCLEVLRRGFAK